MKSFLQINHRDSIFFHENNFIPSFVQSWKHRFQTKLCCTAREYGTKEENNALVCGPAGGFGLVEQLMYLQGWVICFTSSNILLLSWF